MDYTEFESKFNMLTENYQINFRNKEIIETDEYIDVLMEIFGITSTLKHENRQYWGRELGMYWQRLVIAWFETFTPKLYKPAKRYGQDEPYDLLVGDYAIDTKYRVGSGDSGTLKKFKSYGNFLLKEGYKPVFLILRTDNLDAAIKAIKEGDWEVYMGEKAFDFIESNSGRNLLLYLKSMKNKYNINL
ncbi:hypothetical protein [Veillonella parvula]|jgi:apaLI-like restriction endonuclease|uniref:hypothetical protein n=1 Tax=Veillonella parvula TaxID=29466 RepID=UPI0022E2D6E5|nr:hypothetical protein [Veillonella parvula]